jgi:hypothetical protein
MKQTIPDKIIPAPILDNIPTCVSDELLNGYGIKEEFI